MEQMQMTMLSMLQTVAAPQNNKNSESIKTGEGEDFRSMMEKHSKQPETKETTVKETVETELPKEDELDEGAMQELAAMQLFVADTMQIVTVESEETVVGAAKVLLTEETVAMPQQMLENTVETPVNAVETAEQFAAVETAETVEKPVTELKAESAEAMPEAMSVEQTVRSSGTEQKHSGTESEQQSDESFVEEAEITAGEQKVFHEVETAPVKVSEVAAETKTADAESVNAQISDKLVQTLANGETRVELQLNPDHLGKITIELTKSSDGALHVSLFAENSQTRLMLERDMGGLQSLLHQNVREDVQVEVSHQQEAQQHESYEGHRQQNREQQQRQDRRHGEDFLNQLRLGLIPQEEAVS